jgi:lysophospholipase L1-like esterase
MVAIALGSDCCVTQAMIAQALALLGPSGAGRVLVLVTAVHLGGGDGSGAADERAVARDDPSRVLLLDWVHDSAGHPSWFQPDGLHLTAPGVDAFTQLLSTALPYAYQPCPPGASAARASSAGARPLEIGMVAHGRVGTSVAVHVHERGHAGVAKLQLCTTPPGGLPGCQALTLAAGQPSTVVRVALLRPGGWTVTVTGAAGRRVTRTVWASHPGGRLELYAAGDSEMQILDSDIAQDLGPHGVRVSSDARISTGLTNSSFFDWQKEARAKATGLRPDVSIVIMGANDGFNIGGAGCCGAAWSAGYANLVAEMMRTLLRGTAGRVYWCLLPTPSPANFRSLFNGVNAGIRAAARRFAGRVGLIDLNAFFTPGNRYRNYMVYRGHGFVIHEADGIHLSAASDVVVAQLIEQRMIADHLIR